MEFDEYARVRGPALIRFAFLLCGDRYAAEDLAQSALEDALRHWRRVELADHPDRYVQRMLLNRYLRGRRRRWSTEVRIADADPIAGPAPDDVGRSDDRDQLARLLATLPPRARSVLVLRFYLDLDDGTVADLLGIAPGTVRSIVTRGLRALRDPASAGSPARPATRPATRSATDGRTR